MAEEREVKKIVKGGFRATLALIISIIALIFAIISYNRTTSQTELNTEIKALNEKMEKMKRDTAERVNKVREETAKTLQKFGIGIKKNE
jgi:cell division protein FtsL